MTTEPTAPGTYSGSVDFDEFEQRARQVGRTRLDPSDILVTDQVAVVTGGGGGIGQGVAVGLARFGAKVAVLDVVPERCEATEQAIADIGGEGLGVVCDVTDADAIRSSFNRVTERFGRVDILVNNAGGIRAGSFVTQPDASIRRHIEINLVSALVATQEAARRMIAQGGGGSIVNVASIEASRAAPMFAVYAACKAGMVNFTRTMAVELAEHGIRVNCIAPDHTVTPGMRGNRSGPVEPAVWEEAEDWSQVIPLGREGLVDECASAVIWLCSAMASYVTGVNMPVDGGTWASSGWMRGGPGEWILKP